MNGVATQTAGAPPAGSLNTRSPGNWYPRQQRRHAAHKHVHARMLALIGAIGTSARGRYTSREIAQHIPTSE